MPADEGLDAVTRALATLRRERAKDEVEGCRETCAKMVDVTAKRGEFLAERAEVGGGSCVGTGARCAFEQARQVGAERLLGALRGGLQRRVKFDRKTDGGRRRCDGRTLASAKKARQSAYTTRTRAKCAACRRFRSKRVRSAPGRCFCVDSSLSTAPQSAERQPNLDVWRVEELGDVDQKPGL